MAQEPIGRDSAAVPDSVRTLPEITVSVTRAPEQVLRVPAAIGVVDRRELQGSQATLGLDEALNNIPGVYVANRYNYSLDQRLSIRGFGSRANFGLRGVKVLLDGVPQTLPDGQSQLTNVDFANLQRIEVLRGASSSLYGNASGGVLSLTSEAAAPGPFSQSLRVEGGSFGLLKIQGRTTARSGNAAGVLSVSHTTVDGFRQHSRTEFTQLNLGGDYILNAADNLAVRLGYTDAPRAENPGALTLAEVQANRDSAAANNINRKADKDVSQGQLAVTFTHHNQAGEINAAVFGMLRTLRNPLATATYVGIDRQVYGARLTADQRLGRSERAVRVTVGVDLQRMRDDRTNYNTIAGVKDTLTLDQRETVTEVGPFAQFHWNPSPALVFSAGGRFDAVTFDVQDHFRGDNGVDNSGSRTESAFSGNAGVALVRDIRFSPYVNLSTSFETPTTTELANQPNSTGGFNTQLDPQRAVNYEVGVRGTAGRITYSATGFLGRVRNAIVQYSEVGGRAYYANAGRLKNDGLELGLAARVAAALRVFGSYTYANYRYDTYRIINGTTVSNYDGKRLPGVPKAFVRLGLRAGPVHGLALDLDHTIASSTFANDANTVYLNGWGRSSPGVLNGLASGVTNARVSWEGRAGGAWVRPFIGVNNLWDRQYISSLNPNGAASRFFEPAPGRNWYLGGEIGWARRP
jgi:iron complex outermembrane receptor protein